MSGVSETFQHAICHNTFDQTTGSCSLYWRRLQVQVAVSENWMDSDILHNQSSDLYLPMQTPARHGCTQSTSSSIHEKSCSSAANSSATPKSLVHHPAPQPASIHLEWPIAHLKLPATHYGRKRKCSQGEHFLFWKHYSSASIRAMLTDMAFNGVQHLLARYRSKNHNLGEFGLCTCVPPCSLTWFLTRSDSHLLIFR